MIMQATQDALARERLVVLHKGRCDAGAREGSAAEYLGKPAAIIAKSAGPQDLHVGQRGVYDFHAFLSTRLIVERCFQFCQTKPIC